MAGPPVASSAGESSFAPDAIQSRMVESSFAASGGWPNGMDGVTAAVMNWITRLCSGEPATNAGPRLPPAWNLA